MEDDSIAGDEPMGEEDIMANAKVTYEVFVQNNLDATSHTLEWTKYTNQDPDYSNFEFNYFLLGTDAGDESNSNFIKLARIRLPKLVQGAKSVIEYTRLDRNSHSALEFIASIPHEGEVLKSRMNPNEKGMVASVQTSGVINLFQIVGGDDINTTSVKVGSLHGLNEETFCLNWNQRKSNQICSGAGKQVCIWDITRAAKGSHVGVKNQLLKIINPHGDATINDVRFSPLEENMLITAGSDGFFKIWDVRDCGYKPVLIGQGSDDDLNCAVFNNINQYIFAAAGESTGMIGVWDMRMPDMVLNDVQYHKKQVTALEWHPTSEQVFISAGEDGKVYLWDNNKCGEEQARKDYEDGPPELVFPHNHHSSLIEDISWQPNSGLAMPCVASVENQFAMMIWRPIDDFFTEETELLEFIDRIPVQDLE